METSSNSPTHLIRGLGLIASISIIIGNVIGTGVFFKARAMTCNVGTPGWVIAAWIAAGLLSLAGALTYAELTAMKPVAGAEYVFLRDSYGKASSFLYGWMQMFIAKPGSQAALGMAFAIGLNDFLGSGSLNNVIFFQTIIAGYLFKITMVQVVALMVILIFTTLNCASVAFSGQVASALTFVKLALIAFVGIGAFVLVTGDFSHFSMAEAGGTCEEVVDSVRYGAPGYTFVAGFAAAMLGALWGYDGWTNLTYVAGEVESPNRNIPLAIIGSTVLVLVLYVIVHVAYFYVLDPTAIASVSLTSTVGKTVVGMFFGGDPSRLAVGVAVSLFTVGLMLSSLGTLHTSMLSGSRVSYAMAKDGMMPAVFRRLSINAVPIPSLIFQGVIACVLALSGSFDALTNYVIFGSWIFYGLVTSSIFIYRRRFPDAERPYRAFGYPIIPAVFLLVVVWLLVTTIMTDTIQSLKGIGLILLGLPVYFYFNYFGKGPAEMQAGGEDEG